MGVYFRGFAAFVAQQALYVTKVGPVLEQVGGKAVAQYMRGYRLFNVRFVNSRF